MSGIAHDHDVLQHAVAVAVGALGAVPVGDQRFALHHAGLLGLRADVVVAGIGGQHVRLGLHVEEHDRHAVAAGLLQDVGGAGGVHHVHGENLIALGQEQVDVVADDGFAGLAVHDVELQAQLIGGLLQSVAHLREVGVAEFLDVDADGGFGKCRRGEQHRQCEDDREQTFHCSTSMSSLYCSPSGQRIRRESDLRECFVTLLLLLYRHSISGASVFCRFLTNSTNYPYLFIIFWIFCIIRAATFPSVRPPAGRIGKSHRFININALDFYATL